MEGTYPLPEAQLDRFLFKLRVPFPGTRGSARHSGPHDGRAPAAVVRPVVNGEQIMEMRQVVRTVPLAPHVQEYVVKLTLATHPEGRENLLAEKYIRYGSSPRGAQTLILGGKSARCWMDVSTSVWKTSARLCCLLCVTALF